MKVANNRNSNQSAFTIVELLVVIVVIGILAAITIVSYAGISSKATVASLTSDLDNASKQLKLYQVDNGKYPDSIALVSGSYCPTPADTRYCLKVSSGTAFTYTSNNSNNTKTFSLLATKGSTNYSITNGTQPSLVTPIANASVSATGAYTFSSDGLYSVYKFTGNGSITTTTPGTVEVLVVGGGGCGGVGGGGAGGYLSGTETISGTMPVTVGAGGVGVANVNYTYGSSGQDSVFGTRTAKAGGIGGRLDYVGLDGASGGGIGGIGSGWPGGWIGTGISGQGYNGGNSLSTWHSWPNSPSGGGGGAGSVGQDAQSLTHSGDGGLGISNDIIQRGNFIVYAGGGGGGATSAEVTSGVAINGGGGDGGATWNIDGHAGTPNTGGGGGGGGYNSWGGNGGSGIVVIRYLTP